MRRKRPSEGLNLAFLDIMSCGLGAIILVFMLVKRNAETAPVKTELLEKNITELVQQQRKLQARLRAENAFLEQAGADVATALKTLQSSRSKLKSSEAESKSLLQKKQALENSLKNTAIPKPVPKKQDNIELKGSGETDYLIGLKVEGKRIGVLLDNSASMTDDTVIDVIRRKNGTDKEKQAGPKWQRSKRIVKWILARLPNTSQVMVMTYNDQTRVLGPKTGASATDRAALGAILSDLDRAVPTEGTNLEAGLDAIAKFRPTDLYLITDGLPTRGNSSYKSLNPFAECSTLRTNSTKISGGCRLRLFISTVNGTRLKRSKNNVILLPIDGDPRAADMYWRWATMTQGIVISPEANWP